MSFLAFLQHTKEQHFLDLFVGEDVLEVAHAAVIRSSFLLHALEVVGVAAVDADERCSPCSLFLFSRDKALARPGS